MLFGFLANCPLHVTVTSCVHRLGSEALYKSLRGRLQGGITDTRYKVDEEVIRSRGNQ